MKKARTLKMQTGNVEVEYLEYKRDASNKDEVLSTFQGKVVEEQVGAHRTNLILIGKQKKSISVNPGDVIAKYPEGTLHVFPGYAFYDNHKV